MRDSLTQWSFADAVPQQLAGELAEQVTCVRQALGEFCQRAPGAAVERLAAIPRRSPMADWRILVRGLLNWQAGELAEASAAWSRLDRQRRPWRIATSLVLAHRDDLTELKHGAAADASSESDPWVANCDDPLLVHAKLVRQSQVQRVALRNAAGIAKIKTEAPDATVCPDQIAWLRKLTKQYQSIDPALVQSLHETTIMRALLGPYVDVFEQCVKSFRGPRHDRTNMLAKAFFHREGGNDEKAQKFFSEYLKTELPQNPELSESLRGAIASQVYCTLAAAELSPPDSDNMMSMLCDDGPDEDLVEEYFENAIQAYPANRNAYEGFQAWYRQLLSDDDLRKDYRRTLEAELAAVLTRRLQHLPDDTDSRLELVDYLLEKDRSEEAQTHIEWLSGTRRDNPLADAMTWKWNLQEAMRMSRRKAWLSLASGHLDTAQSKWPQWLSSDWLPYLRAVVPSIRIWRWLWVRRFKRRCCRARVSDRCWWMWPRIPWGALPVIRCPSAAQNFSGPERVNVPIIRRGSPLPARYEEAVSKMFDEQRQVVIEVLQGEHPEPDRNLTIGTFELHLTGHDDSHRKRGGRL